MRVLVTGGSGLVGRAVIRRLESRGDEVVKLVRRGGEPGIRWDPKSGALDSGAAENADAVVHLAGENVAAGRWTAERKAEIRDSRVLGTRHLVERLATLARRPRVMVSASATGFYGNRGDSECTEETPLGRGFLAEVCRDWEAATVAAAAAGIRVVLVRIGLVLATEGGALARMIPVFRLGLGGRIGDGAQWMSWITLRDLVRIIERAIDDDALGGPVNAVAPNPLRNRDFTGRLAGALGRPALLPVPAPVLRFALGEMADEMLLMSTRVVPRTLMGSGFAFEDAELSAALSTLVGTRPR